MKKILFFLTYLTLKLKLRLIWMPLYHAFNFLVLSFFKNRNIQIWPRNSFVSKALTPPLSDLDYTIIYNKEDISRSELLRKIKLIKKVVPLFKEANVYQKQHLDIIVEFINPYELKRDPQLKKYLTRLNINFKKNQKAYATVFIVKALEHDFHYLTLYPEIRVPRWKNLFSIIDQNIDLTLNLQQDLSYEICKLAKMEGRNLDLLRFIQSGFNFHLPKTEIFTILFPIKYIIHCFDSHLSLELPFQELDEYHQEILVSGFEWEVSGLLSQAYLESNHEHYLYHLENLKSLLSASLSSKNLSKIENSLKTFSELLCLNDGK